jgi:hypothetical protein
MSTEHWWSGTGRGKPKFSDKNLSHFHFIHYKSHMDWLGIFPGIHGDRPETNRLNNVTAF